MGVFVAGEFGVSWLILVSFLLQELTSSQAELLEKIRKLKKV